VVGFMAMFVHEQPPGVSAEMLALGATLRQLDVHGCECKSVDVWC
jgi:hypothetical protein